MHKKIQGKTGAQNSSQKKKIVPIKMREKKIVHKKKSAKKNSAQI